MSNQIEICAIQLKHSSSSSVMTIIGVYLPSTDHQIEEFENYLQHMLDCAIKSGHDSIWGKFSKLISHSHKASQLTDIFGSPYLKHSWQFYCLQLVVLIVVTRLGRGHGRYTLILHLYPCGPCDLHDLYCCACTIQKFHKSISTCFVSRPWSHSSAVWLCLETNDICL